MTTKDELLALSDQAWRRLQTRVAGLTDEEHLWEPTAYCWTVRRGADGLYHRDGGVALDPPPVATIAWRIWHIDEILRGERNATWLGMTPEQSETRDVTSLSADRALSDLEEAYGIWRRCLERCDESAYANLLGPIGQEYAEYTWLAFILHELDELIHHGAEVGTMRDLYRSTVDTHPFVQAALRADRETATAMVQNDPMLIERFVQLPAQAASVRQLEAVRLLADLDFDLDPVPGMAGPLHYAAATGDLELAQLLVERGADPTRKDLSYDADPLGWARYFDRPDLAAYLENLGSSRS